MFKRNKARRPIAMISTAAAATAVVFAGGLIGAPSAQAAMSSGGCRLTGWAGTNPGVSLYPCDFQGAEGSIGLDVKISNPNGLNIDPCAQLLLVNANGSTSWSSDLGCHGWTTSTFEQWIDSAYPAGYANGTYVMQVGYWYNGSYYGNAQSARIQLY
ncbi:hypothetical protein [Streptomyces sp. NPDC004232]|uniref:hypothetical protein n=1 Tax=unclassified Streptomyces TaxID=2593676 RepID=UPI001D26D4D5|nr:hypothetical protein [Streptomyces sp. tea 10]